MDLTKDEKETISFLLEKQLKQFKGEEITRDVPLKFLEAEKSYEEFLENLIKKLKD